MKAVRKPKDKAAAIEKALELISGGESVRQACVAAGVSKSVFLREAPADHYARARDACADAQFEEMAELERQCLSGEIAPDVYKAAMDTRKWRLARMKPRLYGDKSSVDVNANVNILTKEQRDAAFRGAQLSGDDLK